jgi:hypothetical protein
MSGFLCKIFQFVLNIFEKVVNVVASAVKTIGTAAVDVLSELAHAVGDAASGLFSGNGLFGLLIAGGVLWMLLGSKDDDGGNSSVTNGLIQKRAGSV